MPAMKLISWNINGIRAVHNKNLFLPFLEKEKPDMLALQETKAERGQAAIDLPLYEEYWNSATKKGYSGTAIFTKIQPIEVTLGLPEDLVKKYKLAEDGYGNPNTEGRMVTAEFKEFYLVNSYTPNAKPDLSRLALRHKQWDPAFLAFVKRLDEKKPVIFCGDLNVAHTPDDLANPKANEGEHGFTKEEREGIDKILEAGFVDTFRHFTPKVESFCECPGTQRRLAHRLLLCEQASHAQSKEGRDTTACTGLRSLPRHTRTVPLKDTYPHQCPLRL
jgi:exodeoxyribonuclease III